MRTLTKIMAARVAPLRFAQVYVDLSAITLIIPGEGMEGCSVLIGDVLLQTNWSILTMIETLEEGGVTIQ